MEPERSRNGYFTVTFLNKQNLDKDEIYKLFNTVGKVCHVGKIHQRVFIRYRHRDEAVRAIKKFGETFNLNMAKNKSWDTLQSDSTSIKSQESCNKSLALFPAPRDSPKNMETLSSGFHLILGNLPKNYTVKDVNSLVEEAKPLSINELDETRALHVKFCHVVLESLENLSYLINKLDGFVICGEKIIAVEAKRLLEWKNHI